MPSGHDMALALRAAYWAMHRQADACLAPVGVTANQFVLLALLAERDGVTQRELVERAASDANTVREMLSALVRKGLVTRARHPGDGRAWCIGLSPRGRAAYQQLWSAGRGFRRRLEAALAPQERALLVELLSRITQRMSGDPPPPRSKRPAAARS